MPLKFTIPGKPVSGNHERGHQGIMRWSNKRRQMVPGVRTFVTNEATSYRERVKMIAFAAMKTQGWNPPNAARVDIHYFNIELDRDNLQKSVNDAIAKSGVLGATDYWILAGDTVHFWDDHGPRVEVSIEAVDRKDYDHRSKKKKPAS